MGSGIHKASVGRLLRLFVQQKKISTPIYINKGIYKNIASLLNLQQYSRIAILTDGKVSRLWGNILRKSFGPNDVFITIPAGEKHKNLATVQNIWAAMLQHKFDRKALLVCAGGGVVCDVGAFAASTYMRGIPFMHVPTTLLAQTDAAIGGKTGVNFGTLKNMAGTFAQPVAVVCDTNFLSTLPQREYISGFAEIIKHALIADIKLFHYLSTKNLTTLTDYELKDILYQSCRIKCTIVADDFMENGKRKMLNFGHTFGHALEMASHETNKPLLHGEAVAIGITAEAKLSRLAGLLEAKEFGAVEKLLVRAKLPTKAAKSLKNAIWEKLLYDKKNEGKKVKWALLNGIGKALTDVEQPERLVKQALDYVLV